MNTLMDFIKAALAPALIAVALFLAWLSNKNDDDDWPQHGAMT